MQSNLTIPNSTGYTFRQNVMKALKTVYETQVSTEEPSETFPGAKWADSTVVPLRTKVRNSGNTSWIHQPGVYQYDSSIFSNVAFVGYDKGDVVLCADGSGYWINTVDSNTTNPESAGAAGWVSGFQSGVANVTMSSSSVTLTPAQFGKSIIVITGTLSTNLNLIFPSITQHWSVINNTTGGYSITAKTASGSGVLVGSVCQIFCDGNNILYSTKFDSSEYIKPEWFGAKGDGVTDDTTAVMACFSAANQSSTISTVRLDGVYLCDFTATEASLNCLATITRDGLTISGGTIKVKAGTYTDGVANGDIKIYILFYITGNNNTVEGVTFDVNDQSTNYVHSASLPNLEFRHTYMSGTSGAFKHGNKALNNYYLRGNGQTYVGNYQEHGDIAGNYAEGSIGMGWNASRNCSLDRNKSVSARDAHFGIWLSDRITASGNIGTDNSNGNGFDISGSSNVTVQGGVISGNQNCGIWIGKDPNVSTKASNVVISDVVLRNNQNFVLSMNAEIIVANINYDSSSGVTADGVLITGNTIVGNKRAIFLGSESKNIKILDNSLEPLNVDTPFPNSRIDVQTAGVVTIKDNPTTSVDASLWNDTVLLAGSITHYCDPAKRNYFRSPNGSVVAGGAGIYNDIITLSSTSTHIGRVLMTVPTGQSIIKVKIGIACKDLINYREQEMIFLGGAGDTPIQDATVRSLVGTSAITGWNSTITAVPAANGVIDFYATTPVTKLAYIEYEITGNYVNFVKAYNQ